MTFKPLDPGKALSFLSHPVTIITANDGKHKWRIGGHPQDPILARDAHIGYEPLRPSPVVDRVDRGQDVDHDVGVRRQAGHRPSACGG